MGKISTLGRLWKGTRKLWKGVKKTGPFPITGRLARGGGALRKIPAIGDVALTGGLGALYAYHMPHRALLQSGIIGQPQHPVLAPLLASHYGGGLRGRWRAGRFLQEAKESEEPINRAISSLLGRGKTGKYVGPLGAIVFTALRRYLEGRSARRALERQIMGQLGHGAA